jgi:hypothetical protein
MADTKDGKRQEMRRILQLKHAVEKIDQYAGYVLGLAKR